MKGMHYFFIMVMIVILLMTVFTFVLTFSFFPHKERIPKRSRPVLAWEVNVSVVYPGKKGL